MLLPVVVKSSLPNAIRRGGEGKAAVIAYGVIGYAVCVNNDQHQRLLEESL